MNILFLTTHFNTGGITSYILTLGEALVKSGHKVWLASSGGQDVVRLEAVGMRHVQINIRTKSEVHPKLWLSFGPLNRLIRKEGICIIHSQTRVTQVLGFFLSHSTGIKMVTTCHGFFRPRWFRKIFPCWGDAVIAISKPVAQHLIKDLGVDPKKVHLIANGIDLNHFAMTNERMRREARQKADMVDTPLIGINTPLIGVVARLSSVKGIHVLIKAMPLILKEMPSANLIVAGQGPEEGALKKLTQDLGLTAHVHFKSTTNQTQDILRSFDVFVMPSLMEGLGLSVIEAQACGIPVVASRVGGLVDLIEDGKSGYLVAVNDPAALAYRIIDILRNPEQAKRMADQARVNVEKYFSAKQMLQETLRVYNICQNLTESKG
jgi:glycosyltransferase involved in cell wall biosynthesis